MLSDAMAESREMQSRSVTKLFATGTPTNTHTLSPICISSASMKAHLAERYMPGAKSNAILVRMATKKKKRKTDKRRTVKA